MVICLERGADLHMAQLMPLPLTVSCFSKIQIGLTFLVSADLGSPGKRAVKRVCVFAYSSSSFVYSFIDFIGPSFGAVTSFIWVVDWAHPPPRREFCLAATCFSYGQLTKIFYFE